MRTRRLAVAALGLSCAIGVRAARNTAADQRVEVYLSDDDGSQQLLGSAEWLVCNIYENIGIHIDWRHGEPAVDPRRKYDDTLAFIVRTVRHAPVRATSEALACARIVGKFVRKILFNKDGLEALPVTYEKNVAISPVTCSRTNWRT